MPSWLRLDVKAGFFGWTRDLPAEQYAAFIKMLQVVKAYGERGGKIRYSDLISYLTDYGNITKHAFEEMVRKAKCSSDSNSPAVTVEGDILTVTSWNKYQLDKTNAKRQATHREKRVTEVTGNTVSNGCNDDIRDGTYIRDIHTGQGKSLDNDPPDIAGFERPKRLTPNAAHCEASLHIKGFIEDWNKAGKKPGNERWPILVMPTEAKMRERLYDAEIPKDVVQNMTEEEFRAVVRSYEKHRATELKLTGGRIPFGAGHMRAVLLQKMESGRQREGKEREADARNDALVAKLAKSNDANRKDIAEREAWAALGEVERASRRADVVRDKRTGGSFDLPYEKCEHIAMQLYFRELNHEQ